MTNKSGSQPIDKTELVWPGKRKEVERVGLPFQTIETINLPRGARQEELFLPAATGAAQADKRATITLKDFIIPNPELLPEEVRGKVKNWSDFIDYWAVDWMFNQHEKETEEDDTFHNMNQRYRTRKEPKLELSMSYEYPKAGKYDVLVKVIDIFGNDTTKLVGVKI